MLNKMAHINLTGRAAQILALGGSKNLAQVCATRSLLTDSLLGWDNRLVLFQSSRILPGSGGSQDEQPHVERRPVDQRVQMHRMRNNFSGPGPGLRLAKNRNDLVAEFYDLSKTVIDGQISVDSLIKSNTFLDLDEQLNYHVDIMSNNQIVNILASLIKMGVNPSTGMVKLLEHEVKFRINSIALSQVMKLVKFYNAIDTSYEQKQLADILNNRIRSCLNNPKTTVRELVDIYDHLVSQSSQTSLLSLNEEKLLNLLTEQVQEDDDMVSQYIPKFVPYDYKSLCDIFVHLAAAKRRPTPLLKAASTVLSRVPLPEDEDGKPDVALFVATLNSFVSLNYINRTVVSKLVTDLANILNLDKMDILTKCNLLRSMASLKWRSDSLMKLFYDHVKNNQQAIDHRLILTLVHVTAKLNYIPDLDMGEFYNESIRQVEDLIDHRSRKWLDHVWSLAIIGIAGHHHYQSVLNDNFIISITNPGHAPGLQHSDAMKILNLNAIVRLEKKFEVPELEQIHQLVSIPILHGSAMQKYAGRIREALNGIVESKDDLIHDIKTPFGFIIDSVLGIGQDSNFVGLNKGETIAELSESRSELISRQEGNAAIEKVALIYVLFDEVIRNYPMDPIGHKRIVSRILKNLGYRTTFLPEGVLNREQTSVDLTRRLKEMLLQKKISD